MARLWQLTCIITILIIPLVISETSQSDLRERRQQEYMRRLQEQRRLHMLRQQERRRLELERQQQQQQHRHPSRRQSPEQQRQQQQRPQESAHQTMEQIRRIIQHEMELVRRDMRSRDQSQREMEHRIHSMSKQIGTMTSMLAELRRQRRMPDRGADYRNQQRTQERMDRVLGQIENHVRSGERNRECHTLSRDVQEIKHKMDYVVNSLLGRRRGGAYSPASTPAPMQAVFSGNYRDNRRTTSPGRTHDSSTNRRVMKPLDILKDNEVLPKKHEDVPEYARAPKPVSPWLTPTPEKSSEESSEDSSEQDTSEDSSEEDDSQEEPSEEEPSEIAADAKRWSPITQKMPLNPVYTVLPTRTPAVYWSPKAERRTHNKRHLSVSDFQRRFGDRTFTVPKATSLGGTGRTVTHPRQQTALDADRKPDDAEDEVEPLSYLITRHDHHSGRQRGENNVRKERIPKRESKGDQRRDRYQGTHTSLTTAATLLHTAAPQTDRRQVDTTNTHWSSRSQVADAHRPSTHDVSQQTRCPGYLSRIGKSEVFRRAADSVIGAWMKDSGRPSEKVWAIEALNALNWNIVREYSSEDNFKNRISSRLHQFSDSCSGLGPVVYNDYMYCSLYERLATGDSVTILKISLDTDKVVKRVKLTGDSVKAGHSYRGWAGAYLPVQLAADSSGVWAIYGHDSSKHLAIYLLDPTGMFIRHVYYTNQAKDDVGPVFMLCGTMYALDSHYAIRVKYSYDTSTQQGRSLATNEIRFPFRDLSTIQYNPVDGQLYTWSVSRQQSHIADDRKGRSRTNRKRARLFGMAERLKVDLNTRRFL